MQVKTIFKKQSLSITPIGPMAIFLYHLSIFVILLAETLRYNKVPGLGSGLYLVQLETN